jgi:hypothetical protein
MRCPGDDDLALDDRQGGTLVAALGIEAQETVRRILGGAFDRGFNHRGRDHFGSLGQRELVEPLEIPAVFAGAGDEIHCAGHGVDDRRTENADVTDHVEIGVVGDVGDGDGSDAGEFVGQGTHPQGRARTIGVEGVDFVVHGGDVEDVTGAARGNSHAGHVERLREDRAIDVVAPELAERGGFHVGGGQGGFVQIGAGGVGVVAVHEDGGLSMEAERGKEVEGDRESSAGHGRVKIIAGMLGGRQDRLLAGAQLPERVGGLTADVGIGAGGRLPQVLFGGCAVALGGEEEGGVDAGDAEIQSNGSLGATFTAWFRMAGGAELAVHVGVGVGRLALQEKQRGGERLGGTLHPDPHLRRLRPDSFPPGFCIRSTTRALPHTADAGPVFAGPKGILRQESGFLNAAAVNRV